MHTHTRISYKQIIHGACGSGAYSYTRTFLERLPCRRDLYQVRGVYERLAVNRRPSTVFKEPPYTIRLSIIKLYSYIVRRTTFLNVRQTISHYAIERKVFLKIKNGRVNCIRVHSVFVFITRKRARTTSCWPQTRPVVFEC